MDGAIETPAGSRGVTGASAAAQRQWAEVAVLSLRRPLPDLALPTEPFTSAGTRIGAEWAAGFGQRVFALAGWTGFLFASGIGALVWGAGLPITRAPAEATAGVYALVAIASLAGVYSETGRFRDLLRRTADGARNSARRRSDAAESASKPASASFVAAYILIMVFTAAAYIGFTEVRIRRASDHHVLLFSLGDEFGTFLLVTGAGFLIALFVLALSFADRLDPRGLRELLFWPIGLLAGGLAPLTTGRRRRTGMLPTGVDLRYHSPALDSAMLGLLDCAARTAKLATAHGQPDRDDRDEVKSIIAALERAAREIQHYAVNRVPRFDLATRKTALKDGVELAFVVRAVKAPLARAIHPDDYTAVARTVSGILLAWSESHSGGFDALVSDLPPINRQPIWRRLSGRAWNAALLAVAGVVIPALPAYHDQQATATGARYTLFTAAVFTLITGKVTAWDTVSSTLDKMTGDKESKAEA